MAQQTLTLKTELRRLEAQVHQAKKTPEIRNVLELIEAYRAEALSKLINKEGNREIEVGLVRAYERVLRAVIDGPVVLTQYTSQHAE